MYLPNEKSSRFYASHYKDVYTDLGYDYRDNIFSKTLSKPILNNAVNKSILSKIEKIISQSIDNVKQIRLQYMISLNKTDRNLN